MNKYIILYSKLNEKQKKFISNLQDVTIGKDNIFIKNEATEHTFEKIILFLFKERTLFYSFDIIDRLLNQLLEHNLKISTAESVTGGKLSDIIVNQEGVSKIFNGSIVAYSKKSKENVLKINEKLIDEYGSVSLEVSRAMAEKLKNHFKSNIYISTTGYAGPTGRDVGNIYVTIIINDKKYNFNWRLEGKRNDIRKSIITYIFIMLEKLLKKGDLIYKNI